jgi:uracil-DNA glycosylase
MSDLFGHPALDGTWRAPLAPELERDYIRDLERLLRNNAVDAGRPGFFPEPDLVFNAFHLTPLDTVRVVILGQDPYHGPDQAHGLCFSVRQGQRLPPSLRNVFTELVQDLGCAMPMSGDLTPWARQGVLLLNSVLTVAPGQPASHAKKGWEKFTDAAIRAVASERDGVVFLLWGAYAQRKRPLIEETAASAGTSHHLVCAPHPSPLSAYRGFLGSRPFSTTNDLLERNGGEPIDWRL